MTTTSHSSLNAMLIQLVNRDSLSADQMQTLMRAIMRGEVDASMMAALLVALRMKGETAEEIVSAAKVMREFSIKVPVANATGLLDIVGTGGDSLHTFNISTCTLFVAAAAGAQVCKHGGRSVSSQSGSADVLEALGIRLDLTPDQLAQCLAETGIAFMFAPTHHPAMKHVAATRKALGIRTLFNILGPLTNPAGATHTLLGVFDVRLLDIAARALQGLGAKHALVVHGDQGLDEIALSGATQVAELKEGQISTYTLHPEDFGLTPAPLETIRVASAADSQALIESVLDNQAGPATDIVLLNTGAALYVADIAPNIEAGITLARQALASGAARNKLDVLRRFSQKQ